VFLTFPMLGRFNHKAFAEFSHSTEPDSQPNLNIKEKRFKLTETLSNRNSEACKSSLLTEIFAE
jgi:hypothetical protein